MIVMKKKKSLAMHHGKCFSTEFQSIMEVSKLLLQKKEYQK